MQHKYRTEAIVISRRPLKEHDATIVLLTSDFGLIRARCAGLRKSGSKMAAGLTTLMHANIALIRARDGWRLAGSVPLRDFARELGFAERGRLARVLELVQRLSHGEASEPGLYPEMLAYADTLTTMKDDTAQESAECLAALRVLHILGHDAGDIPGGFCTYAADTLTHITDARSSFVARINTGIISSGL